MLWWLQVTSISDQQQLPHLSGIMQQAAAQKAPFSTYNPLALMSPIAAQPVDLHPLPFPGMDGAIGGAGIALYLGMYMLYTVFFW